MLRRPLAEITANRALNCKLSPYLRGQIDRSRSLGQSCKEIAKTLKLAPTTIYYILDKSDQRHKGNTLLHSGRPKKYTEWDTRHIIHFI
jgi:IS30 family transposase